ncbi:MAG: ribosome biogenesis/translation initiation ATPase RLI [Candidatus Aenigmarchaeota archaeon]|nr:ribosome biogenesis/translation initiation ATPase RLI [Candidatus Aenigmarchaeota archaeon]
MLKKRIVVHDRELCRHDSCGYKCIKVCPINRSGEECIVKGEDSYPVFNEDLCIGCGICSKACEKLGFNAISIVNLPKELEENPIHRYGKNQFSLYKLPIPKKKLVTGLIGPNGVGKTTVLNIISGNLRPNTGLPGRKVSWNVIIDKFKGTELQDYLENLSRKTLKIGYKPQHVDLIPKMWKGKVKNLLSRHGDYSKIVRKLGIQGMLNKDVKTLSGGELQLLAISAVLSKDNDFYFFDEPSSYLDVRQRLMVAREIRSLAGSKEVMIVEHDLAILDYLSDHVHLLYGKPAAFGVVSNPYGVRIGINTYLEGYIKEENVRFRDKPIIFSGRAHVSGKNERFFEFPEFEKNFDDFKLKTKGGEIHKGEVVGVLGPNGIGKTTFIRMLVGELKPDKGKGLGGLKLSYKPQRLVLEGGEGGMKVGSYIENEIGKKFYESEFKKLLSLLGVERNLDKKMKNLSGGELQAVFISCSLGRKHDVLLLDEPSAFLDVEQRLRVAKLIRSHVEDNDISAFVVDHDLQVVDSTADRIMVFEGEGGKEGLGNEPCSMKKGMNNFLKALGITFRRDPVTRRPRANKPDSQKDSEQKERGEFYYIE